MKTSIWIIALAASCAAPLHAQTVGPAPHMNGIGPVEMGGFAGARIRISLGGSGREKPMIRAGLTIAPMQHSGGSDLRSPNWRIGEGLEFGFRGGDPAPQLSLAGLRLTPARYTPGGRPADKNRNNLSGGTTTALVVVGVLVVVGGALALSASGDPDNCTGGECNNN